MSASVLNLTTDLVCWWVRCYAAGLPHAVRLARQMGIESDLGEHGHDADAGGRSPGQLALEVFARWLFGLLADLAWRSQQIGASTRQPVESGERREIVSTTVSNRWFIGTALLLAVLYVALGVDNAFIFRGENWAGENAGSFWAGMVGFVPAAVTVAGLWTQRRWPRLGGVVTLVGGVPVAVLMWWTVIGPILAVLLIATWFRAQMFATQREHLRQAASYHTSTWASQTGAAGYR